ncbi:Hpt domain-containing protein [Pseudomonas akapageensis]|uniref:Hpt domain-containing protein n=1 Tax=Pseudomonas akapageensis TaxID=2609961 RepID=UPI00140B1F55|nr:Hpt domain-containing protein [Pseudomonas akapageensis]
MEDQYPLLLDTFLDDSQKLLSRLHEARTAQALGEAAHTLKGSSSNMGALELADLCRQLEERAQQIPLSGLEELVDRIEQEFMTVRRLYGEERQRFPLAPVR